jgi:hypothetical protein
MLIKVTETLVASWMSSVDGVFSCLVSSFAFTANKYNNEMKKHIFRLRLSYSFFSSAIKPDLSSLMWRPKMKARGKSKPIKRASLTDFHSRRIDGTHECGCERRR